MIQKKKCFCDTLSYYHYSWLVWSQFSHWMGGLGSFQETFWMFYEPARAERHGVISFLFLLRAGQQDFSFNLWYTKYRNFKSVHEKLFLSALNLLRTSFNHACFSIYRITVSNIYRSSNTCVCFLFECHSTEHMVRLFFFKYLLLRTYYLPSRQYTGSHLNEQFNS